MSTETFSLRLRYHAAARHEATAWLIPGSTAQTWLLELQQWQSNFDEARLLVIPAATDSQAPQAVLVLGNDANGRP